jgi:hypothetical protein
MNPDDAVNRAGLEPIGTQDKPQLILLIGKNAQIAPSADLRYTAGTRATNSLVDGEGEKNGCLSQK